MVKVMTELPEFKKGSYKGQTSDGLYMDGVLVEAVSIFAKRIVEDMQFLGLFCSSTFGVRTGKSTLAQQMCKYYTEEVNRMHGLNLTFDHRNVVFKTEKLIKLAHKLPKYSAIILDEGDDLTEHSASEKMREIKKFMRKSGQLNLFIIFILPDYFEMPKSIAMHRSNFLIDVKFEGEFERGHFDYYNFKDKKKLYAKGKKYGDYDAHPASISGGRFVNKYCVDEQKYREMKLRDLKEADEKEEMRVDSRSRRVVEIDLFGRIYIYFKEKYEATIRDCAKSFGISERVAYQLWRDYREKNNMQLGNLSAHEKETARMKVTNDTIILTDRDDDGDEGGGGENHDKVITNEGQSSSFDSNRIDLYRWEALENNENDKEKK